MTIDILKHILIHKHTLYIIYLHISKIFSLYIKPHQLLHLDLDEDVRVPPLDVDLERRF